MQASIIQEKAQKPTIIMKINVNWEDKGSFYSILFEFGF